MDCITCISYKHTQTNTLTHTNVKKKKVHEFCANHEKDNICYGSKSFLTALCRMMQYTIRPLGTLEKTVCKG